MNKTHISHNIDKVAESLKEDVIKWRRQFHRHPEPSNQETETSLMVQQILTSFDIPFTTAAETGIIAEIKGSGNPIIGLRTDMDALPIKEETSLDFASENEGFMHACGHDAHMAIAAGVMAVFSRINNLPFSLRCIFQPAEESIPSGALRMIKEGVLKEMTYLVGFHVWPGLEIGTFMVGQGRVTACVESFDILIQGRSGHGASPHKTIDPIVAAAYFISQMQTIVSRKSDPQAPLVISVGKISGGDVYNVIPEQVQIVGTVRSFDPKQNKLAETHIQKLLKGLEKGFGVKTHINYHGFIPAVYNEPALAKKIACILSSSFGKRAVIVDEKTGMEGDDFSFYSNIIPSCYIKIGCGKSAYSHHSNKFNIDEACLVIAIKALSRILWEIAEL